MLQDVAKLVAEKVVAKNETLDVRGGPCVNSKDDMAR